jgi:hypothetical protein
MRIKSRDAENERRLQTGVAMSVHVRHQERQLSSCYLTRSPLWTVAPDIPAFFWQFT